jgi:hypothetical protein
MKIDQKKKNSLMLFYCTLEVSDVVYNKKMVKGTVIKTTDTTATISFRDGEQTRVRRESDGQQTRDNFSFYVIGSSIYHSLPAYVDLETPEFLQENNLLIKQVHASELLWDLYNKWRGNVRSQSEKASQLLIDTLPALIECSSE